MIETRYLSNIAEQLGLPSNDQVLNRVNYSILKAQAAAKRIFKNPELGTEEIKTASLLSRELSKILGPENVHILVKQNIGKNKLTNGVITRDFTSYWEKADIFWDSSQSFKSKTSSESEMGGVVGILEGNDPNGQTIFTMSDLDALPNGHRCGHNAHTAALIMDALILKELKDQTRHLPVNKIVFIGRVNEEGINPNKQFSDAHEMIDAGLIELVGNRPDLILSAHVLPSLKEGEIIIDKGPATHGAGFFNISITDNDSTIPLEVIGAKIICDIAKQWESENPKRIKQRLIKSESNGLNLIVRATDSGSNSNLNSSLIKDRKITTIPIAANQINEIDKAWLSFQSVIEPWVNLGGSLSYKIQAEDLIIISHGQEGHVAAGGVNVEFLNAKFVEFLDEAGIIWGQNQTQELNIKGTIRIKLKGWRKIGKLVIKDISQLTRSYSNLAKITSNGLVAVPPVINSTEIRNSAIKLVRSMPEIFQIANQRLLACYAEPLSFWQQATKARILFTWVGSGDPSSIDNAKKSGNIAPKMQLHSNQMCVEKTAIPYLGILALQAINYIYNLHP